MEALPDLWSRLARLDQRCFIMAKRRSTNAHAPEWVVRIYDRNADEPPLVEVRGRQLVEPLVAAVLAVEHRAYCGGREESVRGRPSGSN